jgi:hypothetical protein
MTSIFIDPMPLAEFESFARRAMEEAEQGEATYLVVRMTMVITLNYLHRGLTRPGRQWAYRLMQFGQDRQDLRSQGMALWLIGYSELVLEDFTSALAHGEECMRTAFAPYDQQMGQNVAGIAQLLLGRVSEGTATLEGHRRHALDNGLQYAALMTEAPLGVAMLLRGELKKGVRVLERLVQNYESEYRGYADWTRIFLAEFYIVLLSGSKKPSWRVVAKNLLFLLTAKRAAARKAQDLLQRARENPQLSELGVFRSRIDFNLGLLHVELAQAHLARSYFECARTAALAQDATGLVSKIDRALRGIA